MLRRLSFLTRIVAALGALGALVLVVSTIVFDTYKIPSESMEPAVGLGDTVLVRVGQSPGLEDIVIATPEPEGTRVIRRVVGMGGDELSAKDGSLIRNGDVVEETYLEPGTATTGMPNIAIRDETVFLLGDYREASQDSRDYGAVPLDQIHGVVIYEGLPVDRIILFATAVLLVASAALVIRDLRSEASSETPEHAV